MICKCKVIEELSLEISLPGGRGSRGPVIIHVTDRRVGRRPMLASQEHHRAGLALMYTEGQTHFEIARSSDEILVPLIVGGPRWRL